MRNWNKLAIGIGACFVLALAGCSKSTPSSTASTAAGSASTAAGGANGKIVLKLAHVQPQTHAFHKGSVKFAEALKRLSNDTMEVQVYPNGVMGNERDLLEALQIGSLDLTTVTSALTAKFDASYQAFSLPFLFKDYAQLFHTVDDKATDDRLAQSLEPKGILPLGYWIGGSRSYYGTSPINSMSDFHGKKVRTLEDPIYVETWKDLGGIPTPLPFGQVYTGLQSKLVDGAEGAINTYIDKKFYEVAPNVADIKYVYSVQMFLMSESSWKKLNAQQQQWVTEAAKEATDYERQVVQDEENNLSKALAKHNVKVTHPDVAPMRAAVQPVYADFHKKYGDKAWAFVQSILKQ